MKRLLAKKRTLSIALAAVLWPGLALSEGESSSRVTENMNSPTSQSSAERNAQRESAAAGETGQTSSSGQSSTTAGASGSDPARTSQSGTSQSGSAQSAGARGGKLPPGHPEVSYLVVPIASPEQSQWMKKGCWAKFHDGENFSGDMLTLVGPVDMRDMTGPFGIDWKGKISSVQSGPKARVMVYDNEKFNDLVATFKPGTKTAQVSKKMGFFDEFSSMRIVCDNVKPPAAKK